MRFDCEPTVCDQERSFRSPPNVTAVAMSTDGVVAPALLTVTVTVDESVVLPTLSVARATIVYVPFAGWLFHVTEYAESRVDADRRPRGEGA